jgi:hypothetical protein
MEPIDGGVVFSNENSGSPALYVSQATDSSWTAVMLPDGSTYNQPQITLATASQQQVYFLFAKTSPASGADFVKNYRPYLSSNYRQGGNNLTMAWLSNPSAVPAISNTTGINFVQFTAGNPYVVAQTFGITIGSGFATLTIRNNTTISFAPDINPYTVQLAYTPGNPNMSFANKILGTNSLFNSDISIPFTGPGTGSFRFSLGLNMAQDFQAYGLQFNYYYGNAVNASVLSYPMLTAGNGNDFLMTQTQADPLDVGNTLGINTYFAMTGQIFNQNSGNTRPASLPAGFAINTGYSLTLWPSVNLQTVSGISVNNLFPQGTTALFVASPQDAAGTQRYYLVPEGDFFLDPGAAQAPYANANGQFNLLPGLSATELITFTPYSNNGTAAGDVLRFKSRQGAYAALFPFTAANGNAVPTDATTLLDTTYLTSWGMIIKQCAADIEYISQPPGASLFGQNQGVFLTSDNNPVLGFYPAAITLNPSNTAITAPLAPYGNISSSNLANAQLLEQQIISPVRKAYLNKNTAPPTAVKKERLSNAGSIMQTTSPQGLYINVDTGNNNQWTLLQLASNNVEELVNGQWVPKNYLLQFTNLQAALQSAFQTNQLFLVMSCIDAATNTAFSGNEMSIEGWPFIFNIPTQNPNGIFNNVLIFKFIKNVALNDLVQKPQQWSNTGQFNYAPDNSSLNNLVNWISTYITSGCQRFTVNGDTDYEKFNEIATNPNWQGIIGLNVNIDLNDFPEQLQGLLAGIDLTRFSAHHFGIDANTVQLSNGQLQMQPNSSLFGLIDYEDVVFQSLNYSITAYQQQAPINTSVDYEFKVLSLKVLFENSKIANFGSYLALTINKLFGETIKPDNRQNLVIFQGSYEDHNGEPVYTFNSIPPTTLPGSTYMLFADSTIINDVEITGATFNTLVSQASQNDTVHSVFSLNGFINFYPLTGFDLMSYGSESSGVLPGQGLSYTNIDINFSFPLATPAATTFSFNIAQTSFDAVQSYSRTNSLVTNFPIQITGILSSGTSPTPASMGYLNVQLPSLQQKQPVGKQWFALQYNLNMGTLGALTGALGFNTTFLAVWNVGGTGAAAAIKLPGVNPQAPFFSLQGVIKINIGSIQLVLADGSDSAYLMKINNIALKLLALSFPSGGNVNFFLFGNPNGTSDPQSVGWYTGYVKTKS